MPVNGIQLGFVQIINLQMNHLVQKLMRHGPGINVVAVYVMFRLWVMMYILKQLGI